MSGSKLELTNEERNLIYLLIVKARTCEKGRIMFR